MAAYWRATWRSFTGDDVAISTSLHFRTEPGFGESEPSADDVLDKLDEVLSPLYKDVLTTATVLHSLEVSELLDPDDEETLPGGAVREYGDPGNLSPGDDKLPTALCAIVSLRTGVPRRWARGYNALPSPRNSAALNSSHLWTGDYWDAVETWADAMDDDYELGGVIPASLIPIVYSRTQRARGHDLFWAQVQAGIPQRNPKWRRSRLSAP